MISLYKFPPIFSVKSFNTGLKELIPYNCPQYTYNRPTKMGFLGSVVRFFISAILLFILMYMSFIFGILYLMFTIVKSSGNW
jgi:hypothetical protein